MTDVIAPWLRPAFRPTGRRASVVLLAFGGGGFEVGELDVRGVPDGVPVEALDVRLHRREEDPGWLDGWRTGALRALATQQMGRLDELDAAERCCSVTVEVDDPADLTHLQLAWAVAAGLVRAGAGTVLDVHAATWRAGEAVAGLAPERSFTVQEEISLVAETSAQRGFGHVIHTRGLAKVGRPDLIAGVPAERLEHTGRVLNHLARMLAEGHVLEPGQRFRFDGSRTLTVGPYVPGGTVPEVNLNNDGLLLTDATG